MLELIVAAVAIVAAAGFVFSALGHRSLRRDLDRLETELRIVETRLPAPTPNRKRSPARPDPDEPHTATRLR